MTTSITYAPVDNSTYLELTGYRVTSEATPAAAFGIKVPHLFAPGDPGINVALVLPRANDPTAMLGGDWGSRQKALAGLEASGTLWSTYGADQKQFDATVSFLQDVANLTVLDGTNSNYVTSAASRTIWVQVNTAADFNTLFNNDLYYSSTDGIWYWNGNLSLPTAVSATGLWFDTSAIPDNSDLSKSGLQALKDGPQSLGNSATLAGVADLFPQDMGALYRFPLLGKNVQTPNIGLIEPAIGSALSPTAGYTFQQAVTTYLGKTGQTGDGVVSVQGESGQFYLSGPTDKTVNISAGERSLDVGIAVAVNPNSDLVLFNGSGADIMTGNNSQSSTYTAIQSATFWTETPVVTWSDSFGDAQSMAPGSPFYQAYWDLYVDAALANQTPVTALGDGGSAQLIGNGLTNLEYNCTQPYGILVGGSSISTLASAKTDPTLGASILEPSQAGNLATIWQLAAGGLTTLPANLQDSQLLVETVWNGYTVTNPAKQKTISGPASGFGGSYTQNTTTSGGIDPTQPMPSYQLAYGLSFVTSDPMHEPGRGAPDVTADGGGNAMYYTPDGAMFSPDNYYTYGTSAASPLWMGLVAQLDAIFADQGLPNLGYANDLLYIASAIAPASFNDVTIGNNTSSFLYGGPYVSLGNTPSNNTQVTPTGFGYEAALGYDLVSGLGSPNGLLLARALTTVAHAQMYFSTSPDMLDSVGGGWASGSNQSLMFQAMLGDGASAGISIGGQAVGFDSPASAAYGWTPGFAQQSLQSDFDANLVRLFDKQGLGWTTQASVSAGSSVSVSVDGALATAKQGTLSSPFGFADFSAADGTVRVARPVAIAETAGGANDQMAIVRMRQVGTDSLSVTLYKVDDLDGTIGDLQPGAPGYAAAAQGRAYHTTTGATAIAGPGFGQWGQAAIVGVDAGDLVAQVLTDVTWGATYWGFAQANESLGTQKVGHLWNYGLNTWGWEDTWDGGDRDYNDLVVGLDFTSASGHGWLA